MKHCHQREINSHVATITALSHEGRGISQVDGKTVFIDGALVGERVQFIYGKRRSQFDQGRVIAINTPAQERVAARCQHYGVCGGCSLQHLDSQAQVAHKQRILLEQLKHFGKVTPTQVLPPLLGPLWHYRRKARLGVRYVTKKGRVLVGFREKNSSYLTDMRSCDILHQDVAQIIPQLATLIANLSVIKHIPQIEVAAGDQQTAFVVRHLRPFSVDDLTHLTQFAKQWQIHVYLQPGGPDTVTRLWPTTET